MKSTWLCCLLALAAIVMSVQTADAAYCGLASYRHGAAPQLGSSDDSQLEHDARAAAKLTVVIFAQPCL